MWQSSKSRNDSDELCHARDKGRMCKEIKGDDRV